MASAIEEDSVTSCIYDSLRKTWFHLFVLVKGWSAGSIQQRARVEVAVGSLRNEKAEEDGVPARPGEGELLARIVGQGSNSHQNAVYPLLYSSIHFDTPSFLQFASMKVGKVICHVYLKFILDIHLLMMSKIQARKISIKDIIILVNLKEHNIEHSRGTFLRVIVRFECFHCRFCKGVLYCLIFWALRKGKFWLMRQHSATRVVSSIMIDR